MQTPAQKGEKKTKKRDPFLLWGEYPHGWQMIKDFILCILLVNSLLGTLKTIDLPDFFAKVTIEPVRIADAAPTEKPVEKEEKSEEKPTEKIAALKGEFSAYNSEEAQTDSEPFTMANGKRVHAGAVANNCLPFGTKILLNGEIKTVEDRMNRRYGCEHFDIWMPTREEALAFGRQTKEYSILQ